MEQEFNKLEIFKKWFRTRDKQGFCSVSGWFEAGKVVVDIGEISGGDNSSTKCYLDAYDFLTWARAVRDGRAESLYKKDVKNQMPTPEAFASFGGSGDVARVFKAHWWNHDEATMNPDGGFAFKCGHFKGTTMGSGAIKPDFKHPLSVNMIKMTHTEVATLANRLGDALLLWGIKNDGLSQLFKAS